MKKRNNQNNNTNYKGKYYDPNYHQNKAKYGDNYDPAKFSVRNPNWEPNKDNYRGRNTNYKGRAKNYNPNYNSYDYRQACRRKNKLRTLSSVLTFLLLLATLSFAIKVVNGGDLDNVLKIANLITEISPSTNSTEISIDSPVESVATSNDSIVSDQQITADISALSSNQIVTAEACDLSGYRAANAKVDIGYGDREYYGYTNEYSQLVYVQADQLIRQDVSETNDENRYCSGQADVDEIGGDYNRGHAIGDELGGVSNAYNIFPQLESINNGQYNDDEMVLQDVLGSGGSITDVEIAFTYPSSSTNIPSSYTAEYTVNGVPASHSYSN